MNEFIITDENGKDIMLVPPEWQIDIQIGEVNDFTLEIPIDRYGEVREGCYMYCQGTEYGGMLNDPEINTDDGTVTFTGDTFRGLLNKSIICPPAGTDYAYINGQVLACMMSVVGSRYSIYRVVNGQIQGNISNYQFNRYCTVLEGIEGMLLSIGARLSIKAVSNDVLGVELSAEPIEDLSEEVEFSQDLGVTFTLKETTNLYTHIVALGKGELKDRTVCFGKIDGDNITWMASDDFGRNAKVYRYEYSDAESEEQLKKSALEKLKEINPKPEQNINLPEDIDIPIGQIVGSRDYVTNKAVKAKVTGKVITYKHRKVTYSYKIGGK